MKTINFEKYNLNNDKISLRWARCLTLALNQRKGYMVATCTIIFSIAKKVLFITMKLKKHVTVSVRGMRLD